MLEKHSIKVLEGGIWSLIPAIDSPILAFEIRDKRLKTTKFAIYELGKTDCVYLIADDTIQLDWWTTLKAFKDGVYVFSRWQDPLDPISAELWAYNSLTGQVSWEKFGFQFVQAQSGGCWLVQSNNPNVAPQCFNWQTGEVTDQVKMISGANKSTILPLHYTENEEHFSTVKRFLLEAHQIEAVWACDYLELKGLIFVSYYLKEADSLANFLLVLAEDGKILLAKKLESDLKAVGVSTFFIFEDHLIFVRNKSELYSIPLKSF